MSIGREHGRVPSHRQRGVSLVELVSVTAVLMVLASITLPVANTMVKRQKELELRRALRQIRQAIDQFQIDTDRFPGIRANLLDGTNQEGYPEELEWLVEGVDIGDAAGTIIKYLRRIPVDPFTGNPFVYKLKEDGFIVYSVGSNEKDDEGRGTFQITKLVMEKDDDWPWREKRN